LPAPLPGFLAGVATLLGMDATATGSTVVLHSMRQPHHLAATWELLVDPASFLFYIGAATVFAWRLLSITPERDCDTPQEASSANIAEPSVLPTPPAPFARWSIWFRGFRTLTFLFLVWLPVRAGLMMSIYLQRVLRSDPDRPLHAMNHFFSPWMLLLLLVPAAFLMWRFVRFSLPPAKPVPAPTPTPSGMVEAPVVKTVAEAKPLDAAAVSNPEPVVPEPVAPARLAYSVGLFALAIALFTAAVDWAPNGSRREGRVKVVERHSTWEPTTTPYDTESFGEKSGYNYAAIYDYLGQYYAMSRLLETDKIDDKTLADCDVLIIKNPTTRYAPEEVDAVTKFVAQGGGLLTLGDHTNLDQSSTILNDITRRMGFTYRNDLLFGFGDSPYLEHYEPTRPAHPSVQWIPPMDFAVSCSIDPGSSSGRPAIANTGLWSMGPEYHNENFHPVPQHCPEMCYGAFVQAWAAWHGQGRALAFTDSTIFSNFCVFQPGKAELMLGFVEWLNHNNPPLNPRPWLTMLGIAALLAGGWWGRWIPTLASEEDENTVKGFWLVLIAAGACGWVLASLLVTVAQHVAVPQPACVRPMRRVVIDRTVSAAPLSLGADTQGDGKGYGLLEQWIARTGCYTIRQQGNAAFSGDALVILCPDQSVTPEYRERLVQYVADGGKLLVIDSPENNGSTAQSLLAPFGLAMHDRAREGKLDTKSALPAVEIASAKEVVGGEPLAKLDKLPVAAVTRYQKGTVMAIGFGSLWNDKRMGEHWMMDPDAATQARYDVLFAFLRNFFDGKPFPAPPPEPVKKPKADLPMTESGPAEWKTK
jgi:hypothetical protein